MADNYVANSGSGGNTFASDDVGGVHYPIGKLAYGALDSATLVSTSSGLPVAQQGTWTVTGGGGTQYTEDAAAVGDPVGNVFILVRDDARGGGLTTANGDNVAARGTNAGELYVKHVDTLTVTISSVDTSGGSVPVSVGGTVTVSGTVDPTTAASWGLRAEDAAHASGHTGVFVLAVRSDTAAQTAGTDGDYCALISDSTGRLHVNVGNTVTVGSHNVTNAGTFAVQATVAAGATNIAKAEDVASADADVGVPAMAVRKATPANTSGTDGDYEFLQMSAGRLWVDASGVTLTVGSHAVTNAGTFAVQVDGSALTALQLIDDPVFSDDAAFTPGTSKVMVAGFQADETSTDSVDEGDAGAARMTLDRKVIVNPQPHTAGGCSIFRSLDLDETEEDVKTSAGQVYGVWFTNTATATRWLKFYNATAANVTVGATTPVLTVGMPGNSSDDITGLFSNGGMGVAFDTAICVAATTGVADADTGAPSANDVIVNIFYK